MEEKIFFYYTSDLHSHFENWPKVMQYMNTVKADRFRNSETYYLLDNGDHLDRVHPLTEASLGKTNVELLNRANYHTVTLGNNEGITLDYNDLFSLYDDASFSVVCANLNTHHGDNPKWLKKVNYIETPTGIRIALIGLTAPFYPFYEPLGWKIEDPITVLDKHLDNWVEKADIVILLSHLGIDQDEQIAEHYPDIDVIIGGHTHHLFRDTEWRNSTILTAAGKFGHYVGEVMLTWDHEKKNLVKKQAHTINVDDFSEDVETKRMINEKQQEALHQLKQPILTLKEPLNVDWFKETKITRALTDKLLLWTEADIAMLNAGLLLDSLPSGSISFYDVHRICPHPINPCRVELTGHELMEFIRVALTMRYKKQEIKGFGFRGKVMGEMIISGVDIETTVDQSGEVYLSDLSKSGLPLDREKTYTVATADMFTFGHLSKQIAQSKVKKFYMPEFLRHLLVECLKEMG